ncbi:MAG: hypothetical protein FJ240_06290 [Nitrospira sp.]|nr:hypothetical protein [Nitrospira sp.]
MKDFIQQLLHFANSTLFFCYNPQHDDEKTRPENERLETGDAIILIGETKSVREIKKLVG